MRLGRGPDSPRAPPHFQKTSPAKDTGSTYSNIILDLGHEQKNGVFFSAEANW